MKYPVPMTAGGYPARAERTASSSAVDAWRFLLRHRGLLAALAITCIVYAPALGYYFAGDDFVVLGSVEYLGARRYLVDTVLMRDIVPSWRPLTGVVYATEWRLFGLDPLAWRTVNLAVHLLSVATLYGLVVRVTRREAIGSVAAVIFGVSGAHFDTVTYVTALPHLLATGFTLASLWALVAYAQDGERNPFAYWLSFGLFVLAFLSNEGAFVYAPLLVLAYALFAVRWRRAPLRLALHAAPFVALAAGWLAFYQSCVCAQLKPEGFGWGAHVFTNYAVYLAWIAYPAHHVPLAPDLRGWTIAAAVAAAALALLVRGPALARIAVVGLALALLPYAPVSIWTASRYTYAAVAFFAPAAAIVGYAIYDRLRRTHRYARAPVRALALLFVATVASLYGWQTVARDARSGRDGDRWALLVRELRENYATVPAGTTIYIIDGPWTNPMEQYTWVPSVARAVYGDAAAFDLPRSAYAQDPPAMERSLFLEWAADGLRPVAPQQVLAQPE